MVQVDIFWSYGLGAGFALASARQLRVRKALREREGEAGSAELHAAGEPAGWNGGASELSDALGGDSAQPISTAGWKNFTDLLQNRFMMLNILYAALLFAPSGIYLLWGYTNWETMQAGGFLMPAWLIVSFAITNVTQAILAFWVAERLIVHGRQYAAFVTAWAGYFGMFFILVNGWDKTGWHRFFSEDKGDFAAWSSQPAIDQVTSWLTSSVALTLYGMGVILIPVMAAIMVYSVRSGYRIGGAFAPNRTPVSTPALVAVTAGGLLSGVPAAIVLHLLITSIGWIPGVVLGVAIVYFVLLDKRFGLLVRAYRMLALEDAAYDDVKPRDRARTTGGLPLYESSSR